ncbi:MAG: SusC/RagA family TonB-linked outer membrane protein, partial [Chlamydiia bacterium]|nr:SusC/RagA family TonB-linked outer membrane protein [Chlamydiia bacterium]
FSSSEVHNIGLANKVEVLFTGVNSGKARESYFGSLGYVYKNRYVLNGSLRRDASSVFGDNNRWGTFYGLGAAWTISEEEFMADGPFSILKLRASYGKTGNDNIPGNLTSSTVWKGQTSSNIVYSFGDDEDYSLGSTINSAPNANLKWEETVQFDIGLDMGLMDDRLSFELDYYHRNNDDLLIQTLLPESSGLGKPGRSPLQWVNAASMVNYGFEFTAGYRNDRSNDFKWDVSGNFSYNHNEVTKLGTAGDIPILSGEFESSAGPSTRTDIGHAIGSFYGYKVERVSRNEADVRALNAAAKIASGGKVKKYQTGLSDEGGDYIWKDLDGNGYIDENDKTYLGNSAPTFQYGATFNAEYKGFDFQVFLQGVAGVEIVNANRYWTEGISSPFNSTTEVLGRWTQKNNNIENNWNEGAKMHGGSSLNSLEFSDWYVESGDYLRIKNIAIGYTFDQGLFDGVFSKFRLYGTIQNLYTFTNYSGYDPEISTDASSIKDASTFAKGIDYFNRPNPTMYRIGIQLNF